MRNKIILSLLGFTSLITSCKKEDSTILVGTYTQTGSKGIYAYTFNKKTLENKLITSSKIKNPSYLTISSDNKHIYAVSENESNNSSLNSFDWDGKKIILTGTQPVGAAPCYVMVNEDKKFVASANYNGGDIDIKPLSSTFSIEKGHENYLFQGTGPDSSRQEQAHIHCVQMSVDGKYLFITDLGSDKIHVYNILENTKEKFLEFKQDISVSPGSGPRHFCFNKKGDRLYLITELSGEVQVFQHKEGNLIHTQSLIADTTHSRASADIHLSPDEKFLYASHRFEGSGISIFKVLPDGNLEKIGFQKTKKGPRNFAISHDGSLMLVASQVEDCIQFYHIDKQNGTLHLLEKEIKVKQPVCIKILSK